MDNVLNVNTQFKKKDIDIFLTSRKKPYLITAEQVIEYWDKKNWLTVKGEKIKSIAALVNVANSYNEKKLNIHHVKYINNRFAWEYLPSDVLVVCESCHRNIHKIPH